MNNILELQRVCKSYMKKSFVLKNINLSMDSGEVLGIVGKNGAGKTTLLKIICGMMKPTSGEVIVRNHRIIGTLIEEPGICMDMSAFENIKMKALAVGNIENSKIYEIIELVGLEKYNKTKVKEYSLGMKQRLGIALALIGEPDIIILDEPINGLDPQGIAEIRELILKLKNKYNKTILVSSHILDELFKICDQYIIMDKGEIISYLAHSDLDKMLDGDIELVVKEVDKIKILMEKSSIKNYVINGTTICVDKSQTSVTQLAKLVVQNNLTLESLSHHRISYEELFFKLIKKEGQ